MEPEKQNFLKKLQLQFTETIPTNLTLMSVSIHPTSGESTAGKAGTRTWTPHEAFWRGFKKSLKMICISISAILPFGFMEPFAFMVWGSVLIVLFILVLGPFLHLKYGQEAVSFFYVEGTCPHCQTTGKLNPYTSTAFLPQFTVLCPLCGQTVTVKQ